MEGERESQSYRFKDVSHENAVANSEKDQLDSSSCRESENIANVAVTTQCNITVDEETGCEQPPKGELMKRLSGWMVHNTSMPASEGSKELDNKENCTGSEISDTSRVIVSTRHSDLLNGETANIPDHINEDGLSPQRESPNYDSEVLRKAKDEGVVDVLFSGYVTKETCCKFVCEILKCVLYQRQQLPMTYDQLRYHQKQQQTSTQERDIVGWRPPRGPGGLDWRKCQRTLQDLDELVGHMEALFSLTLVPRVLLVLGGSLVLPKELYEINMEEVALSTGDACLHASVCLRKIFRTLFVADLLTDARPVHLLTTTLMALGHRDCGVSGFRPKLDFKMPTRVKRQVINIACNEDGVAQSNSLDWGDYVWFQAPITIKGFCK
ncbi:MAD2L1-binding protein isoform X2 [Sardina pilchardus]|uniref:MAD2L1-binding protein isoform X2 n=1 Tax=Sardina pilchardus TaxID=27697 RepID=UPI002E108D5D